MRVPSILRNVLFVLGMGLLTANYVHATAAVLTPAAGQAIQTTNGVRVASGVVRGGYVIGQAALYIAEFGGNVTLAVGSRIAAGAVLAATATAAVAPLVIGGFALGVGAAYVADWLADAQAQGKLMDYEVDATSGKLQKKGVTPSNWQGDIVLQYPQNGAPAGSTIAGFMAGMCSSFACPFTYQSWSSNCTHAGGRGNMYVQSIDRFGGGAIGFCVGTAGQPMQEPPGPSAPTTPTAEQWQDIADKLAAIPVNPKLLESMGKPIPVDPVPVINPPDQSGAADVEIGASNPAPVLPARPHTINGQSTPVPNTVPQQYTQPTWTITPANDAAQPYAVNVTVTSITTGNPATPTNPSTPIPGTATPSTPDVCAQNPSALMCQPPGTITDPNMPPIPELYTRKYPEGLIGVWNTKREQLAQTPFGQLATQIMPQGLGDGGCPTWEIPLNIGIHDYGTYPLTIPCDYWAVIRVILIVSSLFLARALIFGG